MLCSHPGLWEPRHPSCVLAGDHANRRRAKFDEASMLACVRFRLAVLPWYLSFEAERQLVCI